MKRRQKRVFGAELYTRIGQTLLYTKKSERIGLTGGHFLDTEAIKALVLVKRKNDADVLNIALRRDTKIRTVVHN